MARQGADDEYSLSIEELTNQVLQLDRALQNTQGQLTATQTRLIAVEEENKRKRSENASSKSAIRDAKGLKPGQLKDAKGNWRAWSKSFSRWLRLESEELYEAFGKVAKAKDPIPVSIVPESLAASNRWLYFHLHQMVADAEAAQIVAAVRDDNAMVFRK